MNMMSKIYFKGYSAFSLMMFVLKIMFQAMLAGTQEQTFTCRNMKHILKLR